MTVPTRKRAPRPAPAPDVPATPSQGRRLDRTASAVTADGYASGTLDRWLAARDRVNGWRNRLPEVPR